MPRKARPMILLNVETGVINILKSLKELEECFREKGVEAHVGGIYHSLKSSAIYKDYWSISYLDKKVALNFEKNCKAIKRDKRFKGEIDVYNSEGRFVKRCKDIKEVATLLNTSRDEVCRGIEYGRSIRKHKLFRKDEIPPWELEDEEMPGEEIELISFGMSNNNYKRTPMIAYNIKTHEEIGFRGAMDLVRYFNSLYGIKIGASNVTRLAEQKKAYKGEWIVSYYNEED